NEVQPDRESLDYTWISFQATAGMEYAINLLDSSPDDVDLIVSLSQSNDNFDARIALTGTSITVGALNFCATKETSEPAHGGNAAGRSVWWKWTAPAQGNVTISTANSTFSTILAVYMGETLSTLSRVALGGASAPVNFDVTAGATYQIAVDGIRGYTQSDET